MAGYMTASDATGRGVARRMCEHSLQHARDRGFRAVQFETVGRLPLAFEYPRHGYGDALVMFRPL